MVWFTGRSRGNALSSTTMQLVKVWFSLLALAVCVFAAQPPTELQIETTFMPEECPQKAAKGDTISVHYVSP